ncbi:MAG TPA: NAD(P)-dependent oxidoreductase [Thermoleophilia bacterium]
MKIFVAGATGVIGRRLVPLLVEGGHDVVGMSRSAERAATLEDYGARGVVADVFDAERLRRLLADEKPEIVIHELTDIPDELEPGHTVEQFAANRRIRIEGTRNLVEAARAAGTPRIVAQSYAHVYAPRDSWVKAEWEALDLGPDVPDSRQLNVLALKELERAVLQTPGIEGVALRYGTFYGPGSAFDEGGTVNTLVRRRHYPIAGDGTGTTSFVHVDDAAAATVLALSGPTGVFNICDDQPAPLKEWLPFYARLVGAPPPRRIPALAERVLGNEHLAFRSVMQRGAYNAKARAQLGFTPAWVSWRDGFRSEFARAAVA